VHLILIELFCHSSTNPPLEAGASDAADELDDGRAADMGVLRTWFLVELGA
jgi:hypothetical protein